MKFSNFIVIFAGNIYIWCGQSLVSHPYTSNLRTLNWPNELERNDIKKDFFTLYGKKKKSNDKEADLETKQILLKQVKRRKSKVSFN